jgi:GNAT superfamily N-acetyltransferase
MHVVVRNALKADMAAVLNLIRELAVFENAPNAVVIGKEELEQAGFGAIPQFKCFVAEVDKEIVGMALVYFRFSTWKGRTVHLEDLIVTESMRRKGIGKALYDAVLKFGQDQGVKRVQWEVLDWNTPAVEFYQRSGATILKDWWLVHMQEADLKKYIEEQA